ncbi:MAG: hypothetical protein KDA89_14755 [Planctomycetaceae bacterium]|nr:hypothetical protein [Planctomycetaceae bacterium]
MLQHSRTTLLEFLEQNSVRPAEMRLPEFRDWLQQRIDSAADGELFRRRCHARDLQKAHQRRLSYRRGRLQAAQQAWESCGEFSELQPLADRRDSLRKAVAGLTQAVEENRASADKLRSFEQQLTETQSAYETLFRSSAAAQRLKQAEESFEKLCSDIGLTESLQHIEEVAAEIGTAAGRAGDRFEEVSAVAVRELLCPLFQEESADVLVIHGATLGCARGEFDHLIVADRGEHQPAEVMAVVEAKRNINDIAHGFRLRQENLAWFVNDPAGFDPDQYRTGTFPDGVFCGPVYHETDDADGRRRLKFDASSFRKFQRPDVQGYRTDRLCFVTQRRRLLGITSAALSRLLFLVATDTRYSLGNDYRLNISDRRLRELQSELTGESQPMQAGDVLRLYTRSDDSAGRIVFA